MNSIPCIIRNKLKPGIFNKISVPTGTVPQVLLDWEDYGSIPSIHEREEAKNKISGWTSHDNSKKKKKG
jgi:hypothetical protein